MTSKPKFECALITGASSGIGEELCRILAKEGTHLIIVARRKKRLETLAKELRDSVSVDIVCADLADRNDRKMILEVIDERTPELVVNNAGWGYYGHALSYETEISMNMVEVDVNALVEISLESARSLVSSNKKGVIMNVSSVAAFQIFPYFSVYAAAKVFVNRFSESFDEEMKPYGIRVLACCPGMVDTEFRFRASGDKNLKPSPGSMTVEFAAGEVWKQINEGQKVRTFNWRYRLLSFFTKYVLPNWLIIKTLKERMKQLRPNQPIIKK